MARTLGDFEDILEPRRREFTNWTWALKHLNTVSPCMHNKKYSPEEIKGEVLKSPKISNLIDRFYQKNIPKEVVVRKVVEILAEIGYGRKLWVIRTLGYVLSRLTTRVYRGIFVNTQSVQSLKCGMGEVPIMYVPSHRSYADFILMSYLLFYYDIDIPAIAAGMDFHGMKGMGTVLRNTGAFFMRRSYNNDGLYWDVFRKYVHQLVTKGDKGIEFFVEGTRSRSGKSLPPKFGLLTMVLRAFFHGEVPDVLFVPINLSYDRVMEERLFAFELLGVPKPRESTSGFFKSLNIIQEDFGSVYINFGEPISAYSFFDKKVDRSVHSLNSVDAQTTTDVERKAICLLAQKIIGAQQKLCVVTTFNLVATVVINNLIVGKKLLDTETLLLEVTWLDGIIRNMGAVTDFEGTTRCLLDSLHTHQNLLKTNTDGELSVVQSAIVLGEVDKNKLKGHRLSEKTMGKAVPMVMLQTYVNPLLHYFVNPTLIVLILRRSISAVHADKLFEEFNFLRSMFTRDFVLFPENSTRDYTESIEQLKKLNAIDVMDNIVRLNKNEQLLNLFFSLLEPFFHTYYILVGVILNTNFNEYTESNILSKTQCQIERFLDDAANDFLHPYSLSLDTISNCFQNLVDLKMIEKIKRDNGFYYRSRFDDINGIKDRLCDYIIYLPKGVICPLACKL